MPSKAVPWKISHVLALAGIGTTRLTSPGGRVGKVFVEKGDSGVSLWVLVWQCHGEQPPPLYNTEEPLEDSLLWQ